MQWVSIRPAVRSTAKKGEPMRSYRELPYGPPDAEQQRECVRQQVRTLWDDLPDLLTPDEACRVLRIGETRFREELRRPDSSLAGMAFRWGRRYLIPKEALRRLIEGEEKP
jgi:hypothetical protein